jgi:hypothetical protein
LPLLSVDALQDFLPGKNRRYALARRDQRDLQAELVLIPRVTRYRMPCRVPAAGSGYEHRIAIRAYRNRQRVIDLALPPVLPEPSTCSGGRVVAHRGVVAVPLQRRLPRHPRPSVHQSSRQQPPDHPRSKGDGPPTARCLERRDVLLADLPGRWHRQRLQVLHRIPIDAR